MRSVELESKLYMKKTLDRLKPFAEEHMREK